MSSSPPFLGLRVSVDDVDDRLFAAPYGVPDDGIAPGRWDRTGAHGAWLLDAEDGQCIGFAVDPWSTGCPEPGRLEADLAPLADAAGPRFDVPALALRQATAAEVVFAARFAYEDGPTLERQLMNDAVSAEAAGQDPFGLWSLALQAGEPTAHFGLGVCRFRDGDFAGAHRELAYYATLATRDAWTWCWLGRAAVAVGRHDDGVAALRRAVELESQTGQATDAAELLDALGLSDT